MKDFVAFDFETANQRRHSICSVGMVFVENGEIVDTLYELIHPEEAFNPHNIAVHGITPADVQHAPTFDSFYREHHGRFAGKLLVAHYLPFDGYALRDNLARYGITPAFNQLLCTYQLSKKLLPEQPSHTLKHLTQHFGIQLSNHHHALDDARACAEIMLHLTHDFQIRSLEALYEKTRITAGEIAPGTYVPSRASAAKSKRSISIPASQNADPARALYGKRIVFTGKLESLTRTKAAELTAQQGGLPQDYVDEHTDYVVIGNKPSPFQRGNKSSKIKQAELLQQQGKPIRMISEAQFQDLIDKSKKL
ncbi:exonuclease domain-containing protein [Ectobacillus ponti]|uniref:Exonuclease domain-containing protein n=1 Tax=Ectobacillus ponti TaxID=2961894 RepID=A0AA41XAN3_9BACI|nr:exonuclease domain-containing protein [Ectobacillus ponti]MCP8969995.1 exonuclease domain-containing protein [Ectobacillus ponti]